MVDLNKDGVPDVQVTVDGHKVNTKDLFPDAAARLDFHTKLKLLKSKSSGEDDGPVGAEDSIAEQLFSPPKKKPKAEPRGDDGEPDGMQGLE